MAYKDPEKRREYDRRRQAKRNKSAAKWREKNRARHSASSRKCQLLSKYGLTGADIEKMVETQAGLCAICNQAFGHQKGSRPHVDHCHETRKVRGILCGRCNSGIGMLGDDVQRVISAAKYLLKHLG